MVYPSPLAMVLVAADALDYVFHAVQRRFVVEGILFEVRHMGPITRLQRTAEQLEAVQHRITEAAHGGNFQRAIGLAEGALATAVTELEGVRQALGAQVTPTRLRQVLETASTPGAPTSGGVFVVELAHWGGTPAIAMYQLQPRFAAIYIALRDNGRVFSGVLDEPEAVTRHAPLNLGN